MGQILKASCECGARYKNISFGGDKANYLTVCMAPALNIATGKFEVVNYYDYFPPIFRKKLSFFEKYFKRKSQPDNGQSRPNAEYVFYNDEKLKGPTIDNNSKIQSWPFEMNARNNFCPDCNAFTFNFHTYMFTD